MSTKQATVIGVSGFLGSYIAKTLLAKGFKVHGSCRTAANPSELSWLNELPNARENLHLFEGDLKNPNSFEKAIVGSEVVFVAAFPERPSSQELVDMVLNSSQTIASLCLKHDVKCLVITSSTGSANPPGHDESTPKNELVHFSDPQVQLAAGKFSPAAKTLMEKSMLKFSEENPLRICIFAPSGICGPPLAPDGATKSFISYMLKIIRDGFKAPNGSMSFIDVRDLVNLQIAAYEQPSASGRYWGVKESWHWKDILPLFKKINEDFKVELNYSGEPVVPTQYDLTRQNSLGVHVRGIPEIFDGIFEYIRENNLL